MDKKLDLGNHLIENTFAAFHTEQSKDNLLNILTAIQNRAMAIPYPRGAAPGRTRYD